MDKVSEAVIPMARLLSPRNGDALAASQRFTWSTPGGAVVLAVGSARDAMCIAALNLGRATAATVNLPLDRRLVYVTLWTWLNNG